MYDGEGYNYNYIKDDLYEGENEILYVLFFNKIFIYYLLFLMICMCVY